VEAWTTGSIAQGFGKARESVDWIRSNLHHYSYCFAFDGVAFPIVGLLRLRGVRLRAQLPMAVVASLAAAVAIWRQDPVLNQNLSGSLQGLCATTTIVAILLPLAAWLADRIDSRWSSRAAER
jgi:hypothetical protein